MHRRRPVRALVLLLGTLSLLLAGLGVTPAAAAPTAPAIRQWFVYDQQIGSDWTYSPTSPGALLRFEVELDLEGHFTRELEYPADQNYAYWTENSVPAGTAFTWSIRAVETSGPGPWTSFSGKLGGRLPDPPTSISTMSRPDEDVLRVEWEPGTDDEVLETRVDVVFDSISDVVRRLSTTEDSLDVPHAGGRSTGTLRMMTRTAYGWSHEAVQEFTYEDQWPAPVWMQLKPRAGGFFVAWRSAKKTHKKIGTPDSWLGDVDGEPVDFETTRRRKDTIKGFVRGLTDGTEHVVTVRGVTSDFGPGLPISATGRTFAAAEQMAAPRVKPGRRGGDRTVLVSWGDPEWGEASPCCFRLTAVGRGAGGKKTTIRRFVGADLRRTDFGVGTTGPWRFTVEAKTGTGFSPVSGFSTKVRAR